MTDPPLLEAVIGLIASVGAWFSWMAKKEAGEANRAVNHTDKGQPRLYDIALNNATNLATIKERQRNVEANIGKLSDGQDEHAKTLAQHSKILKTHGKQLENLSKTND